jgi:6-phosphofructokinase 1
MTRRIAVLTGDNDAPGMNAVIRAVTRTALHYGWAVMGVCDGFRGLITGDFVPLTTRDVEGIIHRSGSLLDSVDSKEILARGGQKSALKNLAEHNVDALIVIGGEKSLAGAAALSRSGFPVNGVAASIENDLAGFDMIVGVDTALNIALDAIDQLKIAGSSNCGAFLVEVAGRKCGYLAVVSGIAGGAEVIVMPEVETTPQQIEDEVNALGKRGTLHPLIVIAEGAAHNADQIMRHFGRGNGSGRRLHDTRLGHAQRRAAPNAFDRMLGTRFGACAIDALERGEYGVVAGSLHGEMLTIPLHEVVGKTRGIDPDFVRLADVFAPSVLSVKSSAT